MEYKTCSKCKETKPTSEFYKQTTSKDGLGSYCKSCIKEYKQQWIKDNPYYYAEKYEAHKEENKQRHHDYYLKHTDEIREYNMKWKIEHPQESKKIALTYYYKHSKEINERAKVWRKEHPEETKAIRQRYYLKKKLNKKIEKN